MVEGRSQTRARLQMAKAWLRAPGGNPADFSKLPRYEYLVGRRRPRSALPLPIDRAGGSRETPKVCQSRFDRRTRLETPGNAPARAGPRARLSSSERTRRAIPGREDRPWARASLGGCPRTPPGRRRYPRGTAVSSARRRRRDTRAQWRAPARVRRDGPVAKPKSARAGASVAKGGFDVTSSAAAVQ